MREIVLAHIKKLRWTATVRRGAVNVSWVVKFAPVNSIQRYLKFVVKRTYIMTKLN